MKHYLKTRWSFDPHHCLRKPFQNFIFLPMCSLTGHGHLLLSKPHFVFTSCINREQLYILMLLPLSYRLPGHMLPTRSTFCGATLNHELTSNGEHSLPLLNRDYICYKILLFQTWWARRVLNRWFNRFVSLPPVGILSVLLLVGVMKIGPKGDRRMQATACQDKGKKTAQNTLARDPLDEDRRRKTAGGTLSMLFFRLLHG